MIRATLQGKSQLRTVLQSKRQLRATLNNGSPAINASLTVPKAIGFQDDYNKLRNLPQIESVTLMGNKSFDELGMTECSNQDVLDMFK